ncbi:hypothetical protein C8Q76DRAFT_692491 [Earliella scabrosa]|nr:hypothetical protein C8Q76DRAFT_692491 [Earliella scabrosa]
MVVAKCGTTCLSFTGAVPGRHIGDVTPFGDRRNRALRGEVSLRNLAHFETPHEYEDVLDDLVSAACSRAEAGRPLDCVAVTVPYRNTDLDVRLLKLLDVHCAGRVLLKDRYRPDDKPLVISKEGKPAEDFELDAEYYLASVSQSPERIYIGSIQLPGHEGVLTHEEAAVYGEHIIRVKFLSMTQQYS